MTRESDKPPTASPSSSAERSKMVEVASFASRWEAETIGHALDDHDIPFTVKSEDVGVFGPGMGGFTPGGARLFVPDADAERVAQLLTCVVQPLEEGQLGDPTDGAEAEAETTASDR